MKTPTSEKWLSENLAEKFPATTLRYSMVKIARGKHFFSDILELEASPVEDQSLPQKDQKRRKTRGANKINKTRKA